MMFQVVHQYSYPFFVAHAIRMPRTYIGFGAHRSQVRFPASDVVHPLEQLWLGHPLTGECANRVRQGGSRASKRGSNVRV